MVSGIYDCLKEDLMVGAVNLGSGGDTIKVGLLDDSHAFSAANSAWADVSANEISGTGYTAGGVTLGSQAVSVASNTAKFDAADTEWTSASFTAYHAVIYDTTNSNSLICSIDFGGAQTVSSGTFTIQWHTDGILSLS
jgi:hypothetical protein